MQKLQLLSFLFGLCWTTLAISGAPEPVPQNNPHRQQAYRIVVHTNDAPGAFDSVAGNVLYRVESPKCLAWKDRWAGVPVQAEHNQAFALHPVASSEPGQVYEGVMYVDQLVDQDYYGLGVCHWSVNMVTVDMKLRGVAFTTGLDGKEVARGGAVPTYFIQRDYRDTVAGHPPELVSDTTTEGLFKVPTFSMTMEAIPTHP